MNGEEVEGFWEVVYGVKIGAELESNWYLDDPLRRDDLRGLKALCSFDQ